MRPILSIAVAGAVLSMASTASADPDAYASLGFHDVERDAGVAAIALGMWVSTEAIKPVAVSPACVWCDHSLNPLDSGIRRALVANNPDVVDKASSLVGFGGLPILALIPMAIDAHHSGQFADRFGADFALVAEPVTLAMTFNQFTKYMVQRQRPYARFPVCAGDADPGRGDCTRAGAAKQDQLAGKNADANLSFFSGHTTFAFTVAAATGTVLWRRGDRLLGGISWIVGGLAAASVGLMRIAADRHYFTDVMTGMLFGSVFGVGIPYLAHPEGGWGGAHAIRLTGGSAPGGGTIGVGGLW